tara:strand:- start:1019 stop:1231 length:213 start_codon:yes stop_codon:yes gene_type:complete
MERKTKEELCKGLALDYAYRAKPVLGVNIEDAYDTYLTRCAFREYDNVLHQYEQGPLKGDPSVILTQNKL